MMAAKERIRNTREKKKDNKNYDNKLDNKALEIVKKGLEIE